MFKRVLSTLLVGSMMFTFIPTMPEVMAAEIQSESNQTMAFSLSGQSWGDGYGMNAVLSNNTGKTVQDWKIVLDKELTIDTIWCTDCTVSGGKTVITPLDWNRTVDVGADVQFGFNGKGDCATDISYTVMYKIDGTWYEGAYEATEPGNPETPSETPSVSDGQVKISYEGNGWGSGYTINVIITNDYDQNVSDWKVVVPASKVDIDSIWCASTSVSDGKVTITPEGYNKSIAANGNVNFGFNGKGQYPSSLDADIIYKVGNTWYSAEGTDVPGSTEEPETPALSSDASIAAISVKDVSATKTGDTTYEVELPEGVKLTDITSADIKVRTSTPKAKTIPAKYNNSTGEAVILVTAEDGTRATYTLTVKATAEPETPALSSDNTIGTIFVKNVRATKTGDTSYEVELPEGVALADVTKEDISVRPSVPSAKVISPMYNKTTGVASIAVTAENGKMAVYTLTVKAAAEPEAPALSSDASIAAIFVKDVQATKTGDTTYEVELPEGIALADVTSADFSVRASYGKATVTPAKYNKTTGEAVILVTAEDGTRATYTLTVKATAEPEAPALSSDNTIGTIFVKNVRATKTGDTTYEVELTEGVALSDVPKEDISVRP